MSETDKMTIGQITQPTTSLQIGGQAALDIATMPAKEIESIRARIAELERGLEYGTSSQHDAEILADLQAMATRDGYGFWSKALAIATIQKVKTLQARIAELEAELTIHKKIAEDAADELAAIKQQEPVAITDDMALAFHLALTDGSIGHDELEEIKKGLRAAFVNLHPAPIPEGWQPVPKDLTQWIANMCRQFGQETWEARGRIEQVLAAAPKPGEKP